MQACHESSAAANWNRCWRPGRFAASGQVGQAFSSRAAKTGPFVRPKSGVGNAPSEAFQGPVALPRPRSQDDRCQPGDMTASAKVDLSRYCNHQTGRSRFWTGPLRNRCCPQLRIRRYRGTRRDGLDPLYAVIMARSSPPQMRLARSGLVCTMMAL